MFKVEAENLSASADQILGVVFNNTMSCKHSNVLLPKQVLLRHQQDASDQRPGHERLLGRTVTDAHERVQQHELSQ